MPRRNKHGRPKNGVAHTASSNSPRGNEQEASHKSANDPVFEAALQLKLEGNGAFGRGVYSEALEFYERAWKTLQSVVADGTPQEVLQTKGELVKVFSNMAQCDIELKDYSTGVFHAKRAIQVDNPLQQTSASIKARYRLALCYNRLKKPADAIVELTLNVRQQSQEAAQLDQEIRQSFDPLVEQNRNRYRRLIDSHRVRVHDIAIRNGAEDAEGSTTTLRDLRAYCRAGLARGVLANLTEADVQAISYMAVTDDFSNIGRPFRVEEMRSTYARKEIAGTMAELRAFSVGVLGPIENADSTNFPWDEYLSDAEMESLDEKKANEAPSPA